MALSGGVAWQGVARDIFTLARYGLTIPLLMMLDSWPMFWRQLSFMVVMAVITYPVRAVRWGMIYTFFLFGIVWGWVIVAVEYVVEVLILREGVEVFRHAVIAPAVEEPLKILPLVLALLVGRWPFRHSYGAADLMNLGGALGAGVAFFETLLLGRPFRGVLQSPEIFGFALLPDALSGYLGSGAATAMIGMAIGYLLYAIRWRRLAPFGVLLVLLTAAWVMIDHGMHNYRIDGSGRAFEVASRLWAWEGEGRYTPYLFLAWVVLTVCLERYLLWRMLREFPKVGFSAAVASVTSPLRSGFGYRSFRESCARARRLLLYVLAYRQMGYLRAHTLGERSVDRAAIGEAVARRTGEIIGAQAILRAA